MTIQFFILAPYVGFESTQALLPGQRPDVSWLGIALSASSLVVMPYLGIAKQGSPIRPARRARRPQLASRAGECSIAPSIDWLEPH